MFLFLFLISISHHLPFPLPHLHFSSSSFSSSSSPFLGELLQALEAVTKDALKCSKVRAFLVSSPYIGYETGNLIYLRRSTCAENTRYASTLELYQVGSLTNYFAVHIIIDNYDKTDSYHLSIILFHDFSINMFNSIYFHF